MKFSFIFRHPYRIATIAICVCALILAWIFLNGSQKITSNTAHSPHGAEILPGLSRAAALDSMFPASAPSFEASVATAIEENTRTDPDSISRTPGDVPEGLDRTDWDSIWEAHDHWLHSFVKVEDGYRAKNKSQAYVAAFDGQGVSILPDGHAFKWGIELASVERGETKIPLDRPDLSGMRADGRRLEVHRGPGITEWFVNRPDGIQQGWILDHRPPAADSDAPLRLVIDIQGEMEPRIIDDGVSLEFGPPGDGEHGIRYSDLAVFDAHGKSLPASFEINAFNQIAIRIADKGGTYPIMIDPLIQQRIMNPAGIGSIGGAFGASVAISGNTVVVGAPGEDSASTGVNGNQADNSASGSGAAYVFLRSGSAWSQQAYLKASNTEAGDAFGRSVGISGDTIVVGAYLEDSAATAINGDQFDNSASGSGAAYIFVVSESAWIQQAYLKPTNADEEDYFGRAVAISGDTVVIGAENEDSSTTGANGNQSDNNMSNSGAAYIFVRIGNAWSQQAYLKASNTGAGDNFAGSVAISGDTVVVGAIGEASAATGVNGNQANNSVSNSGAAYVFVRDGNAWSQQAYLKASNTGVSDFFGSSVSIWVDTIVVGAFGEASSATGVNGDQFDNSMWESGAAYVFVRSASIWNQQAYLKPSYTVGRNRFGDSVSVFGDTVAVGAWLESGGATGVNGNPADLSSGRSGAAYIFVRDGQAWSQQAYLKASNTGESDYFGRAVSVSGDMVVVGADKEDSAATGIDGDQADNSSTDSGAAYVFVRNGSVWNQEAYLKASNTGAVDNFGFSVDVSGDTVIVGAEHEDSAATGVNGNQADNSALRSGAAYVFVRNGSTWSQQAYLKASNTEAGDSFGRSVAISGDKILVGAFYEDSAATGINGNQSSNSAANSGAAYIFTRNGSVWIQEAYLKASNTGAGDNFGGAVAISGDTVVVGAVLEDSASTGVNGNQNNDNAMSSGAAYVFIRSGSNWIQQAYLKASNTGAFDFFGDSVAVSGDTVVIGAVYEDSNAAGVNGNQADNSMSNSGAAYVFVRNGSVWNQQAYLKASNTGAGDSFGGSVAISGDTIVIGADGEDSAATGVNGNQTNNSEMNSGAAYVFVRNGSVWSQQAYLKASNTEASDLFGASVSISTDRIVVGARFEDSSSIGINGSQVDNSAEHSGAAYVFVRNGNIWVQHLYLKSSSTSAFHEFANSVAICGEVIVAGTGNTGIFVASSGEAAEIYIFTHEINRPMVYFTHSQGNSLDNPPNPGDTPKVYIPGNLGVRTLNSSSIRLKVGNSEPGLGRPIFAEGIPGRAVVFIFEDVNNNRVHDPGERILAERIIHVRDFGYEDEQATVDSNVVISPPDILSHSSPVSRDIAKIVDGVAVDQRTVAEPSFAWDEDAQGNLTITPRVPDTGYHIPWRMVDHLGIAWPVWEVRYQVRFAESPDGLRMAALGGGTPGPGMSLTLPPGVSPEIVYASALDSDEPLASPAYSLANGAFEAMVPGRFVIKLDPTPGTTGGEVYVTVIAYESGAVELYDQQISDAVVGTAIIPPPGTLSGRVHQGDRYATELPGGGNVFAETGQIIPVNAESGVEIWWSEERSFAVPGIGEPVKMLFPGIVKRHNFVWPEIPAAGDLPSGGDPANTGWIVIASQQGSGLIDPSIYKNWDIYYQNDPNLPGFNPNDEHASKFPLDGDPIGQAIFALRNDLGRPDTSEPYVLMSYREPDDSDANKQYRFKVFGVVAEDPDQGWTFDFDGGIAGNLIQPFYPLTQLRPTPPEITAVGLAGPFFRDRKGDVWARAAGDDGGEAVISIGWHYRRLPDYYFPPDEPPYAVNGSVPLLDNGTGIARATDYIVAWPSQVPELNFGETLVKPKNGLPAIDGNDSVQVIFQQGRGLNGGGPTEQVKLIDYLAPRKVKLSDFEELAGIPGDVASAQEGPVVKFGNLPPSLAQRLTYSPSSNELFLRGFLLEPAIGSPWLLLNVITPAERAILLDPAFRGNDNRFLQALIALCDMAAAVKEVPIGDSSFDSLALTAGYATGEGYVTLAMNNDADLSSPATPVSLEIIRVAPPFYRGIAQVIEPDSIFDEKLSLLFDGDLAGLPQQYEFQWMTVPASTIPSPQAPQSLPGGAHGVPWLSYALGTGINSVTIEGAGLQTLTDNYFTMRYRPLDPSHPLHGDGAGWSTWTPPQLAEGWMKRVVGNLNLYDQKFEDFSNPARAIDTTVSMLSLAGARWEGNIPLTQTGAEQSGVIEAYETVLKRGIGFSIEASPPFQNPDADNALILMASRIANLYMLLGNEAYADAADPTIAISLPTGQAYAAATSTIHCFQNIVGGSSLLEEELSLLRGRDDLAAPGTIFPPVYNRLIWNFSGGDGEVAYANNYGLRDNTGNGQIDEADAKIDYPQGHGDAWGHYLTSIKSYYRLLRNPNFTWQARSEQILLGGVPVEVDYLDERTFAKAAASRARTGAEVVALTHRERYREDPKLQWRGYKDDHTYPDGSKRAWGVDEWSCRAGQGAYLDWMVGNALLPAEDAENTGIQKVDRTTVPELREIVAQLAKVQSEIDKADRGLNPLGIMKGALPMYELSSADVDNGITLFEKSYQQAATVLNNAVAVFNRAAGASSALREQNDQLSKFQNTVNQQEMDFRNRLIEIYGYPYSDDIGGGRTYPTGYNGPDIYHYMYVNPSELIGISAQNLATEAVQVQLMDYGLELNSTSDRISSQGVPDPVERTVTYHLSTQGYGFIKPASWTGNRQAQGQIQVAISELHQARGRMDRAIAEYDNHLSQNEDRIELLEAQHAMNAGEILVQNTTLGTQVRLNDAIRASRQRQVRFRTIGRIASLMSAATAEAIPTNIIGGLANGGDFGAPGRSAIRKVGTLVDQAMSVAADAESLNELGHQQAKEIVQKKESIQLSTLRTEFAILQEVKHIEALMRQEAILRLELFTAKELVIQAAERYKAHEARGQRLLEELLVFRQRTASEVQQSRYKDMAFRIFRNDALEKYRAQFDVAAAWVYMAARAYDYDTNWAGDGSEPQGVSPGREFLESIVKARAIGEVSNGYPITSQNSGDGGLADPMARMKLNWDTVKGPLGYNQPQNETIQFSLRRELLRIPAGSRNDRDWREALQRFTVSDLRKMPEIVRHCQLPGGTSAEPAIVIPFSTLVEDRLNFFAWPLAGGDNAYSSNVAATKIHKLGVWFSNYNNTSLGLSNTPRVYLVPMGVDVMRSPRVTSTREWRVVEQVIPTPLALSGSYVNSLPGSWVPGLDPNGFLGSEADIRRFADFRAYHDAGSFNSSQLITSTRLIGRSVWNTNWFLVIRGGSLLNDPNEGLERFINGAPVSGGQRDGQGIKDILLNFQTYAIDGF